MGGKNLVGLLAATLLCVAPAVLMANAANAASLKLSVDSVDFEPNSHLGGEIVSNGFSRLVIRGKEIQGEKLVFYPLDFNGGKCEIQDGSLALKCTIDQPNAETMVNFTTVLPNSSEKKIMITVEAGNTAMETISKDYVFWTKKQQQSTTPNGNGNAETTENVENDQDDSPYDENDNPLTRGGLSLKVTYNQDLDSFKDKGVDLGGLRTFTNVEVSAVTRITPVVASKKGNLDLKPMFGYYSTDGVNSHSSELLADGGGSFMRGGLLARWYTDSSVLELGPAINWGDTIKESSARISGMATWKQNLSLNWLGLKGRMAENTLRGVLNGPFLSWNIRDQVDFPIDNPSKGKPMYWFSLGTTYNAVWNHGDVAKSWYDWQTWGGLTVKIKPWSGTGGVVVAENGLSAYTEHTMSLEGANRKIR